MERKKLLIKPQRVPTPAEEHIQRIGRMKRITAREVEEEYASPGATYKTDSWKEPVYIVYPVIPIPLSATPAPAKKKKPSKAELVKACDNFLNKFWTQASLITDPEVIATWTELKNVLNEIKK